MNLKPFNLERALAGDPVVTRDCRKVTKIFKGPFDVSHPVMASIENNDRYFGVYCVDGFCIDKNNPNPDDLFMAPAKKTYWMNVYKNITTEKFSSSNNDLFESIEDARESINLNPFYPYHSTVPIEIEE